jgi:type I restriction enzyme, S subunit
MNCRYLYFLVISPEFQAVAKAARTGSAQPFLSLGHLRAHPVRYHEDMREQERIAAILTAYEDLIEVNHRRIALLDEMVRRLFEEWFVRFRFPGHAGHAMAETPEGLLPEGWTILKIGNAFGIMGGGTPSKAEPLYWEGGLINWYTPSDLTGSKTTFMDSSSLPITEKGLRRSSAQMFPPLSVMMTSRATIGAISINTTEACTNQGFITCVPNERVPLCFLLQWLRTKVPLFVAHATGSTFKEITKGVFRQLSIAMPPAALVAAYESRTRPILDMILNLERAQRRLVLSRDLLLPCLMSGELTIGTAEQELEAVA